MPAASSGPKLSSNGLCMFYRHNKTRGYMANSCICFPKHRSSTCTPICPQSIVHYDKMAVTDVLFCQQAVIDTCKGKQFCSKHLRLTSPCQQTFPHGCQQGARLGEHFNEGNRDITDPFHSGQPRTSII
jgi:hypothetical protein